MSGYVIRTTGGETYRTDDAGRITDRTDGPRGFEYSGRWQIIGIGKRHHSRRLITLAAAANGADIGQGWVHDIDHGYHRMWGGGDRRIASVSRVA